MKTGIFALLLTVCSLARAQTYDLSITMTGAWDAPPVADFAGSFSYANGVLSNVNVSDALFVGGTFTNGQVSGSTVQLIDTYQGTYPDSSFVALLDFNLLSTLGGSSPGIDVSSVSVGLYGNHPTVCGGNANERIAPLACSATVTAESPVAFAAAVPASAPEIGADAGALTLLAAILLLLEDRRRHRFRHTR